MVSYKKTIQLSKHFILSMYCALLKYSAFTIIQFECSCQSKSTINVLDYCQNMVHYRSLSNKLN